MRRVTCGLEQQGSILLVVTVDHERVEVFVGQFLDRGERFERDFDRKLKLAEDLGHNLRSFFIWAEKQGLVAHSRMVGTPVCTGKLLM